MASTVGSLESKGPHPSAGPLVDPEHPPRRLRPRHWLLAIVAAGLGIHGVVSLVQPLGYISIDETAYHLMAKNAAAGELLEIFNGYEEFASEELQIATITGKMIVASNGRLVPAYPPFYSLLAGPAAWVLGLKGLFLINALAFVVVVLLTHRLARVVTADGDVAALSVLVLGFGTFLWDYSQGIWPHMIAVALECGSYLAAATWFFRERSDRSGRLMMWSGLLLGMAVGVRLDAVFLAPAILLPFVWEERESWKGAGIFALGFLPPLVLIAMANELKFGVFSPFAYDESGATKFAVVVTSGAVLAGVGFLVVKLEFRYVRTSLAVVLALLALVVFVQSGTARDLVRGVARGIWSIAVDFDESGLRPIERRMVEIGELGGVLYIGAFKKALVQSIPFVSIGLAGLLFAGSRKQARMLIFLLGPLAVYLGFYGATSWHGGLCLSMRYLLPALPMLAVVVAVSLRDLGCLRPDGRLAVLLGGVVGAAAYAVMFGILDGHEEFATLKIPLVLSASIALAAGLSRLLRARRWPMTMTLLFFGVAFVWSVGVNLAYDAGRVREWREASASASEAVAAEIVDRDALVFMIGYQTAVALIESDASIRIARPDLDDFRDFEALTNFHLAEGRAVYAFFPIGVWQMVASSSLAELYQVEATQPVPGMILGRVRSRDEGSPASSAPSI